MSKSARTVLRLPFDPLDSLRRCGGYYKCPRNSSGKRLGPLVGYAGTYDSGTGERKHYVGDVFFNFARAEQYPHILDLFAHTLAEKIADRLPDVFLGAPMGGILLASALGRICDRRVIFAEKKIKRVASGGIREESILLLDRHGLRGGDEVYIVEDVCNNFTTTESLMSLVESHGGEVTYTVCAINRADLLGATLLRMVDAVLEIPTKQYRQDDPEVTEDIVAGNVIWKPKDEWERRIAPFMK